jgi:hypothetical protein
LLQFRAGVRYKREARAEAAGAQCLLDSSSRADS